MTHDFQSDYMNTPIAELDRIPDRDIRRLHDAGIHTMMALSRWLSNPKGTAISTDGIENIRKAFDIWRTT